MKKINNSIPISHHKLSIGMILFFASALFVILFSRCTSPLYSVFDILPDQSFFQVVGFNWLEGRIPYRDLFDLKGPMIFAINAAGYWLTGNRYGICIIQTVLMFFNFIYCYKLLRVEFSDLVSIAVTVIVFLCFADPVYDKGDNVEEFVLPFIFASCYYGYTWLRQYDSNKETSVKVFIPALFGIVLGISTMTRITNAVGVCILALYIGIILTYERKYKELLVCVISFFTAAIVICLPFIIYFWHKGALSDLIYSMFIFASRYATQYNDKTPITLYNLSMFFSSALLLCVAVLFLFSKAKFRRTCEAFFLTALASSSWLLYSIRLPKYTEVMLPYAAIAVCLIHLNYKSSQKTAFAGYVLATIAAIYCLFGSTKYTYYCLRTNKIVMDENAKKDEDTKSILKLLDNVPLSDKKQTILIDNITQNFIYIYIHATPPYKYFAFQSQQSALDKELFNAEIKTYKNGNAQYIIARDNNNNLTTAQKKCHTQFMEIIHKRYDIIDHNGQMILYRIKQL